MIEANEKYNFDVYEHDEEWCKGGPWFNGKICQNIHGPLFEELFFTARQDRYDLMCGLHTYDKLKDISTGATYLCGGRPLPEYSNVVSLVSLCITIPFIDTWINILDKKIL